MESEDVYTLMMDALDGELSEAGRAELESHLRARPDLAQEWAAMQAVDTLLQRAPLVVPPATFVARTVARLPNRRRRLWTSAIVYLMLLGSGLIPLAAIIWIALAFMPGLDAPVLAQSLWQAGGELVRLAQVVVTALLGGIGQLVAEQPALVGWLLLMMGIVALWGGVYNRLVLQPGRST
jgi:anti-sigma factor RsiW